MQGTERIIQSTPQARDQQGGSTWLEKTSHVLDAQRSDSMAHQLLCQLQVVFQCELHQSIKNCNPLCLMVSSEILLSDSGASVHTAEQALLLQKCFSQEISNIQCKMAAVFAGPMYTCTCLR